MTCTCPHPLDPLCVAIMLRLSNGSMPADQIAQDLEITLDTVVERLRRLSMLGAVRCQDVTGEYSILPEAHRIILDISRKGLAQVEPSDSSRDKASFRARLDRLQRDPMFRELPSEELHWMACVSRTRDLAPGEVLLLEGDECPGLYIVDRGTIRLSKASSSHAFGFGREQTIRLMGPGESFNEVPVIDDGTNPVTAEALDEARVFLVPKKHVQDLMLRSPHFTKMIISIMGQRLRHMLAMVEDVSMRDVTGRVAKILLQVQSPKEGVGAGLTHGRRLTQREIAEMAGTAREVVARTLKKMEQSGAITVHRGEVLILDAELLESIT